MLSPASSTSELELTLPSSQSLLETIEPQTGHTYSLPPCPPAPHLTGCGCRWRNPVGWRQISAGWCSSTSGAVSPSLSHLTIPGSHWSETFFSEFASSSPSSFSSHCVFSQSQRQHSSILTSVSFNFNYNNIQSSPYLSGCLKMICSDSGWSWNCWTHLYSGSPFFLFFRLNCSFWRVSFVAKFPFYFQQHDFSLSYH